MKKDENFYCKLQIKYLRYERIQNGEKKGEGLNKRRKRNQRKRGYNSRKESLDQ